eukprot:413968-Rhodomonas_salina.5
MPGTELGYDAVRSAMSGTVLAYAECCTVVPSWLGVWSCAVYGTELVHAYEATAIAYACYWLRQCGTTQAYGDIQCLVLRWQMRQAAMAFQIWNAVLSSRKPQPHGVSAARSIPP